MSKILVADDMEGIRQMIQLIFEDDGYRLVFAENGLEAFDMVKRELPDLVLMDIKMPVMSGLEALKKIRGLDPELPVFILTVHTEASIKEHFMEIGISGWINKPVDVVKLKKLVKNNLSISKKVLHREKVRGII